MSFLMFSGSIVAIVTPMLTGASELAPQIDFEALNKLCEWHIQQSTQAIVVMGTTGESALVSEEQYLQAIELVVKQVAGRVPVIAGTGAISTRKTISLTKQAEKLGADAVLVAAPYYCNPTQEGLYQHFATLAKHCPMPIILYNVPGRTVCDMLPETVIKLAKIENIVAIKEATGKVERVKELIEGCDAPISLLSGDDETALDFMTAGGDGVISVTANVAPALVSKLCDLAKNQQFEQAKLVEQKLADLNQALFLEANPIPVKWALARMGMMQDGICQPLTTLSEQYHSTVLQALEKANVKTQ